MALLGIDIGTSAVKAAAFSGQGRLLAEASRTLTLSTPHAGWAEQDPREWWTTAADACAEITANIGADKIRAVGIAGQSWAMVLLDGNGDVLFPTPLWMDQRAADICANIPNPLMERAFNVSGNPFAPGYTTPKLMWMWENRPKILEQTKLMLQSNSYIAYKLTGVATQDHSQGYGLHCYNMREGKWDMPLAGEFGLREKWLPPIAGCSEIIGRVSDCAALATGLAAGTSVVAGGLDAACAALGAGVVSPGQVQEQGGQAGGMGVCLDENSYVADARLILSTHVLPGRWLLQGGTVGGGGALKWMHAQMGALADSEATKRRISPYQVLCEWADSVPPGSEGLVFLPYLSGERSPIWDANAKGAYYGLDYGKTIRHIARATLEGTAYALRHNIETAHDAGTKVGTLHAMGGAALSPIWTQIKADICQRPVRVPDASYATTLGAAILAGISVGEWRDGEQAAEAAVRFTREHEPKANGREAYEAGYRVYRALYPALRGI